MRNGSEAVSLVLDLHFLRQVSDADHQHSGVAEHIGSAGPFHWNESARPFHMELFPRGNWMTAS